MSETEEETTFVKSSGNVFTDLRLPDSDPKEQGQTIATIAATYRSWSLPTKQVGYNQVPAKLGAGGAPWTVAHGFEPQACLSQRS